MNTTNTRHSSRCATNTRLGIRAVLVGKKGRQARVSFPGVARIERVPTESRERVGVWTELEVHIGTKSTLREGRKCQCLQAFLRTVLFMSVFSIHS